MDCLTSTRASPKSSKDEPMVDSDRSEYTKRNRDNLTGDKLTARDERDHKFGYYLGSSGQAARGTRPAHLEGHAAGQQARDSQGRFE